LQNAVTIFTAAIQIVVGSNRLDLLALALCVMQ